MAKPLTKRKKESGDLYVRPSEIDKEIDAVISLSLPDLKKRLAIADSKQNGHLSSETLIHLIRNAFRQGNKPTVDAVIKTLFIRCEANLLKHVSHTLPNAQNIREEVLAALGKLIARDGIGNVPDRLDLFEWRFNMQFRSLRLDAIRHETSAVNRNAPIAEDTTAVEMADIEAAFEKVAHIQTSSGANAIYAPSPEDQLIAGDIYKQINQLPKDERDALIATKIMGMTEQAAGAKLGVSERTIGTRKRNAIARLECLKERT